MISDIIGDWITNNLGIVIIWIFLLGLAVLYGLYQFYKRCEAEENEQTESHKIKLYKIECLKCGDINTHLNGHCNKCGALRS